MPKDLTVAQLERMLEKKRVRLENLVQRRAKLQKQLAKLEGSIVSIGGDTDFTNNLEYRIPIIGPITFAVFDDFGLAASVDNNQLQESPEGYAALNSPLYGCPVYNNGTCEGGQQIHFSDYIRPLSGTNFRPRMSTGAELQVIMPIINAPVRVYYAWNPMRIDRYDPGETLITRSMFPPGGAGDYSYQRAIQLYGPQYLLREPHATFRVTVSTTF